MSNAVATNIETLPVATHVPAENSLIHMIERAARDPSVDLDKLERLMSMHERITASNAAERFNEAMAAAQADMRAVATDSSNIQTKSRYASYHALDRAIRPIYTKHGFSLSFNTADCEKPDTIRVICDVALGRHSKTYHIDMPADGKGAKGGDVMTKTHAVGAGASYGQRYLLKMIFNIAVGEDTDGNMPKDEGPREQKSGCITIEQADELREGLEAKGASRAAFLQWVQTTQPKVKFFEDIPVECFESCKLAIANFKKAGQ